MLNFIKILHQRYYIIVIGFNNCLNSSLLEPQDNSWYYLRIVIMVQKPACTQYMGFNTYILDKNYADLPL